MCISGKTTVRAVLCIVILLGGCASVETKKAPSGKTVFYPLPPDPPRIQFLTSINGASDIVPARRGLDFLLFGERDKPSPVDALQQPHGIAVHEGRIYVCDRVGGAVKVIDTQKRRFYPLNAPGQIIQAPTNMCIDSDGYKFIVETERGYIHVFDPQDEYKTSFQVKEGRPSGVVAVGKELFVSDLKNDRIQVLDRATGRLIRALGGKGSQPGQFLMPNAIARDAQGDLYVSDQMNYRFQKIDREGKPLLAAGQAGDSYGTFARPRGIDVGSDGTIYVTDANNEVVQMFNQQGQVLMAFGNFSASPGFLELPAGVAVDKSCLPFFSRYVDPRFEAEYLIFVVSSVGKARVGVYAFGHLKPEALNAELPIPDQKEKSK